MSSALFQQVAEATRGEYVLHTTLGHSDALGSAFLAHEVASGRSVLLVVPPDAESLDVVGALSDTIPADAGGCAACGFRIGTWVDACPRCERSLLPPAGASPDAAAVRDQLRETLDVIGSVPHMHGGTMYFAHEVNDGRLTAFVVRPQADGHLGLDVVWEVVAATPAAPTFTAAAADAAADAYVPYPATAAANESAPADASPTRRAWLPIGLGLGAVALIGAAAFAFTRRETPPPLIPVTKPDSGLAAPLAQVGPAVLPRPTRDSSPVAPVGGTSVLPVVNDSVLRAQQAWRRRRDSLRAASLSLPAVLTIDAANLPTGWVVSVNGAAPTSTPEVQVPSGAPALIRIEAPGYCADTLSINPAPHSHQHWAPTLRGTPTLGAC